MTKKHFPSNKMNRFDVPHIIGWFSKSLENSNVHGALCQSCAMTAADLALLGSEPDDVTWETWPGGEIWHLKDARLGLTQANQMARNAEECAAGRGE